MGLAADDPECAGPPRGVCAGSSASWLDRRPEPSDRLPLGRRQCRRPCASTRRNWSRSPPTSSWPIPAQPSRRCCRRPAPFRSCSRWSPTRSAPASSTAWRARAATSRASPISNMAMGGKWLELLKEIVPDVTRAAVLRESAIAAGPGQFGAIQAVAPSLGVELRPIDVSDAGEIERDITAFAQASERRPDRDREPGRDRSPRADHRAGGPAPVARRLQLPLLRHQWRPDRLWT